MPAGDRLPEGGQVLFEVAAGVDLGFARGEVWVLTVFLRATAREVLGGAGDARGGQLLALQSCDEQRTVLRGNRRN